jgi:mxaC protein
MSYAVAEPRLLWLLLLAPLPFLVSVLHQASFPSLEAVPRDLLSSGLSLGLRTIGALAIAAAVIGLAGPYQTAQSVKLLATGAHVVLVMDRSLSMDFSLDDERAEGDQESKTQIAGRLLTEFVARSPHDQFGVVAFSSAPVFVLPITGHRDAVRAAIAALMRPGIEGTNVGLGLELALRMIALDPNATSPAILLVSDGEYGGAGFFRLNIQESLREGFRRANAHLYWLFLRAHKGTDDDVFGPPPPGQEDTPHSKPERHMDLFFKSLGVTYRVFWADSPRAVQDAIDEINRLETRPVTYLEDIPRKDLTRFAYATACFACLLLLLAKLMETDFRRAALPDRPLANP